MQVFCHEPKDWAKSDFDLMVAPNKRLRDHHVITVHSRGKTCMSVPNVVAIHHIVLKIFCPKTEMATALKCWIKSQSMAKISRILLKIMNISITIYLESSYILIWIEAVLSAPWMLGEKKKNSK